MSYIGHIRLCMYPGDQITTSVNMRMLAAYITVITHTETTRARVSWAFDSAETLTTVSVYVPLFFSVGLPICLGVSPSPFLCLSICQALFVNRDLGTNRGFVEQPLGLLISSNFKLLEVFEVQTTLRTNVSCVNIYY